MRSVGIRGTTRLVGLLGHPVAHSISPAFQNHLLAHYGLDMAYVPLPVAPWRLHAALQALRACDFAGANVTVPHKRQVIALCDRVSGLSAMVGAVNTLYFRDGMLCGTTTDAEGFFRAVERRDRDALKGSVVVLGNGGVARTLAFALAMRGECASLCLAGRSTERVRMLADEIRSATGCPLGAVGTAEPGFGDVMARCTLCVNGTSAGMHPHGDVSPVAPCVLHKGMLVFDTVYAPAQTRLMSEARQAGCRVENGLRMLVYQGLASFSLWTGIDPDESLIDIKELQAMVSGG